MEKNIEVLHNIHHTYKLALFLNLIIRMDVGESNQLDSDPDVSWNISHLKIVLQVSKPQRFAFNSNDVEPMMQYFNLSLRPLFNSFSTAYLFFISVITN